MTEEIPIKNTALDDLCGAIGYTATQRIACWYGDTNLYIPNGFEDTPLRRLIGAPAYRKLVEQFGATTIWIPHGPGRSEQLQRRIAELTVMGHGQDSIADILDLTPYRVRKTVDFLRDMKLLAVVAKRRREKARANRWKREPQPVVESAAEPRDAASTLNSVAIEWKKR